MEKHFIVNRDLFSQIGNISVSAECGLWNKTDEGLNSGDDTF